MSGRGGRGGWRGRGRGNPMGPVAKDDDGNIVDSTPAGPPPLFPEVELPHHPDIAPRDQMLLLRRNDLMASAKRSPFFLETKDNKKEDVEAGMERYFERAASTAGDSQGPGSTITVTHVTRKRAREPLTSVIKLLPEYFPEELYSTSDRKHAKYSDSYWKRTAKKDDSSFKRLDQLAQLETAAGGEGGGGGGGGNDDEQGEAEEDEPHDTDDEEDMDNDDYYQGEHFDDDEGYDDGGDDGGGDDGGYF